MFPLAAFRRAHRAWRERLRVITGGSRGIGYAIARALAMEGADVVITGRDLANLTKSAAQLRKEVRNRAKIVAMACDVRDPESVARLFAVVKRRFRKLDILVNNAGISQPPTSLQETTLELWRDQIDTNLTGLFLVHARGAAADERGATIINNFRPQRSRSSRTTTATRQPKPAPWVSRCRCGRS